MALALFRGWFPVEESRSENRGADEKVVILLYLGLAAALAAWYNKCI